MMVAFDLCCKLYLFCVKIGVLLVAPTREADLMLQKREYVLLLLIFFFDGGVVKGRVC